MKITVTKYLNIRVGKPSLNAACYQYLAPGSEIEVDGQLYKGDSFDGNDTWMKDGAGNYYWSGGIISNTFQCTSQAPTTNLSWSIRLLGIDKVWTKTKGAGIKVAIIDTGLDLKNEDLKNAVSRKFNILNNTDDIQDKGFHGTYCASIIASRGFNGLIGIAPECELIIIKVVENEVFPTTQNGYNLQEQNRLKGINKAIELGADIISMSFGSTVENASISIALKNIIQSGKICIAAAGNNSSDVVNYPANIKGMISVGNILCLNPNASYGQGEFKLSDRSPGVVSSNQNEGITIVAPGDGVGAYDTNGRIVTPLSGTSFAAPYVAGVAALWLSVIRTKAITINNSHIEFRKFLIENARNDSQYYTQGTWGAGVISPSKIFSI